MTALAIDFGTTTTVAAVRTDGAGSRLVAIDGSPLLPSSVFLTDSGTLAVGRDADRQARLDPSRYEPNPKRRIDDGEVMLGAAALPVTELIAAVLRRVADEVRRQFGSVPAEVRLTHPARWGRVRQQLLVRAASAAGLGEHPLLVPEPVAAATHFATLSAREVPPGSGVAVFDLGGGTVDVAVLRLAGVSWTVVAEAGLPDLGGVDFDNALVGYLGDRHGDEQAEDWARLLTADDQPSRRQRRIFDNDVRDCKEALSRFPQAEVPLPPPLHDQLVTRNEFEHLIRPKLARGVELLVDQIERSDVPLQLLSGIYLVGGSSRIPLVARLIQERLALTPTTLDQPETSVASGALLVRDPAALPSGSGGVPATTPSARASGGVPAMPPTRTGSSPVPSAPASGATPAAAPPPVAADGSLAGAPPTRRASATSPPQSGAPRPAADERPGTAAPGRTRGLIAGGVVVAVLLAVGVAVLVSHGTDGGTAGTPTSPTAITVTSTHPTPSPSPSPRTSPSPSPGTTTAPSKPSNTGTTTTSVLSAVSDPAVRAYLRPRRKLITSCAAGKTELAGYACQLTDGLQLLIGSDTGFGRYTSRKDGRLVGSVAAAQNSWKDTTWHKGSGQGHLRTWVRNGSAPLLYFDRNNSVWGILGIGSTSVTDVSAKTLMTVWQRDFEG